jgi:hypothetical protein
MLKPRTLLRVLLVFVLLAAIVVHLVGADNNATVNDATIQSDVTSDQPSGVIACNTGDPGSSSGGCGGG